MLNTYIMVWIEEDAKWDYYLESFDDSKYKDGYVDYYIKVDDCGIIVEDTYCILNKGNKFKDEYKTYLWNNIKN